MKNNMCTTSMIIKMFKPGGGGAMLPLITTCFVFKYSGPGL